MYIKFVTGMIAKPNVMTSVKSTMPSMGAVPPRLLVLNGWQLKRIMKPDSVCMRVISSYILLMYQASGSPSGTFCARRKEISAVPT